MSEDYVSVDAQEAIQSAWIRGFVNGLIVSCCAAALMYLASHVPEWLA